MEIIRKITATKLKKIIVSVFYALTIILLFAFLDSNVAEDGTSVLKFALVGGGDDALGVACLIASFAALASSALCAAGIVSVLKKRGGKFAFTPFLINFVVTVMLLSAGNAFGFAVGGGKAALAFCIFLQALGAAYGILCRFYGEKGESVGDEYSADADERAFVKSLLAVSTVSMALLISVFAVPLCSYRIAATGETVSLLPAKFMNSAAGFRTFGLCVFGAMFALFMASFAGYLSIIGNIRSKVEILTGKVKKCVYGNVAISVIYFIAGISYSFWRNTKDANVVCSTVAYIPTVLALAAAFALAVILGKYSSKFEYVSGEKKKNYRKAELAAYGLALGIIAVLALVVDIVVVRFNIPNSVITGIRLNGYNLLKFYPQLGSGFQLAAFFVFALLVIAVSMTVVMLISLISRSRLFYKIAAFTLVSNSLVTFAVGIFGKYYEMATEINRDTVLSLIQRYVDVTDLDFEYKVQSKSFWLFLVAMAVLAVALIRVPYTKGLAAEENSRHGSISGTAQSPVMPGEPSQNDFDACPAFTELDGKISEFSREMRTRLKTPFESLTLPALVRFVVDYARDSRLHLSYTVEDMADFVAGLGTTRLTILQGMSGTGKTSLPKIFSEAVMGNCEIVEVESSWRDKNELLGYYNEFSKTYTPKKFTQALYKAKLNPDVITLIVLDELNLSRIEYYFSDFLSIMEHEEGKREIKLLNVRLYNTVNGEKHSYSALSDDHTLKIPSNVWFVGTANRDESTFEISDKVYDRAHTMNFNTRAKKPTVYNQPPEQKYLSLTTFLKLIEDAKASQQFDIERSDVIKQVEEILSPYNISFGNRVARQIEDFVKIYCACFYDGERMRDEAVEKIMLSKVVSKLEFKNIDDKEALAEKFERLELNRCAAFVRRLNED